MSTFNRKIAKPVTITLPNGKTYQQPTGIFINNEFYETDKTIDVETPTTGEHVTAVSSANDSDVNYAVDCAEKAFDETWAESDPFYRAKLMLRLADLVEENRELMAAIESYDNGKTLKLAQGDIQIVIDYFRYNAGLCDKVDGRTIPTNDGYVNYTEREPIGVCGQIIPWNFPIMMLSWKIAPAVATGNTVVLKPASATPLNALFFAQLTKEAGFPDGVINIVPGPGRSCGEAILNHPKIRKIAFTGSTAVGRDVMVKAAQSNLKKVSLELGGKSAHVVFADCDMQKTLANLCAGIFANAGQICSSGSRVYVEEKIYDELLSEFKKYVEKNITVGSPFDESNYQGAITNKQQYETILHYIELGKKSKTAKLLTGGEAIGNKGYYIQPTVFYDVDQSEPINQEEIFGPVVTISKFTTIDEVAKLANDSEYGLGAGVQTTNISNAMKVAKKLKSGTVWVNCYNDFDVRVPFGGYKQSGFGRDQGIEALDNYTQVKAIRIKLD